MKSARHFNARLDAAYAWLVIAVDHEVSAWSARRGYTERSSPLVAGDPAAAEMHAAIVAVVAAAASVEALKLETLGRLRSADGRDDRWDVPRLSEIRQERNGGRGCEWERVIETLRFDDVLDDEPHWEDDLRWLFDARNDFAHFETVPELLIPADNIVVSEDVLSCSAELATKAVRISIAVHDARGVQLLDILEQHRPSTPWFDETYP